MSGIFLQQVHRHLLTLPGAVKEGLTSDSAVKVSGKRTLQPGGAH